MSGGCCIPQSPVVVSNQPMGAILPVSRVSLYIVYINVVLYATCYQLQRPLEPFMVEALIKEKGDGANQAYANLQSFFQVFQFFGALLAGFFLDKFGYKIGFILNFLASALSYYFLSQATTMEMLYASKVPSMFQHGFLCAQMAISVLTDEGQSRAAALGMLTTCYSIGMVVGPAVGGILGSTGDYYFGAKLAIVGSLVSCVLTFALPSPPDSSKSSKQSAVGKDKIPLQVSEKISGIFSVSIYLLLVTKVVTSIANSMQGTIFPLILKNKYNFDEKAMGFTISAVSIFNAFFNAFLVTPFIKLLGSDLLVVIGNCLCGGAVSLLVQGVGSWPSVEINNPSAAMYSFLFTSVVLTVFQYVLATSLTAETTGRVADHHKGTVLGIEHSLFAASRIAAPRMGVFFLTTYGTYISACVCSIIYAASFTAWQRLKINLVADKQREKDITDNNGERKER